MADSKVFGVKILLTDNASPVTQDTTLGLYNVTSILTVGANSGQANVTVTSAADFTAGELVTISDDNASEQNTIDSIAGNVLTMKTNLANTYTVAANGKVDGNTEFRWLQNEITGVTDWLSGMIIKNGLQRWTRSIDLRRGGNIAQPGSGGVSVRNTSKFWNDLDSLDIYMNGFRAEIWLFDNTVKTRYWSGVCEKPKWTAKSYTIPFKSERNKRVSNLTKRTNVTDYPDATGDILNTAIPLTIGKVYPKFDDNNNVDYNGYARFTRVADKTETFNTLANPYLNDNVIIETVPTDLQIFPNVGDDGTTPPLQYFFKLGNTVNWYIGADGSSVAWTPLTAGTYDLSFFEDYYIHVIEGTELDSFRRIENAFVDIDTDPSLIIASITDYFSETLAGNAGATAENNSWTQFDKIQSSYEIDTWPCKNYLDTLGTAVTQDFDLYAYDDNKKIKTTITGDAETIKTNVRDAPLEFLRLPDYGYDDSGSGDRNKLDIDVKFFDESPDQMNSFLVVPINAETIVLENEATLSNWGHGTYDYRMDGLYDLNNVAFGSWIVHTSGLLGDVVDKNSTTYLEYDITMRFQPVVNTYKFCIKFRLPGFPEQFSFDDCYVGVKMLGAASDVLNQIGTPGAEIRYRRFVGTSTEVMKSDEGGQNQIPLLISDLPDQYYIDNISTNNRDFYYNAPPGSALWDGTNFNILGYESFPLAGINTEELYNSIYELALFSTITNNTAGDANLNIKLYELAIIFRKQISIKNAIYSPFHGRIYNDTWQSRKTATDPIETPADLLEHFGRLQNNSDTSPIPTNGWGLDYSLGAKIKTGITVQGSFDNVTDLGSISSNKIMGQIQNYDECYSDRLKKTVCRDFFLGSWVDKDGFECVRNLLSPVSPTDTISFADITDRTKIRFTERSPAEIYPEPIVRYKKNFASGEYEDIIRVTNASALTYSSGYVEGVESEAQAEAIWTRCNTMWQRTKETNKPPKDLTDRVWFNNPDTADIMAREYIENWITWMSRNTVTFPAHFNVVGDWEETHPFSLQLPHQTNNVLIKCNLTKIVIDPNPPYECMITAMIEGDIPEEFYIKDTWINFGDDRDWKNTFTLQGGNDDIKDTM